MLDVVAKGIERDRGEMVGVLYGCVFILSVDEFTTFYSRETVVASNAEAVSLRIVG
jgi:hypothetical protein